ncbi:MAG: hypothetical protein CMJ64_28115 [Planctomycetaceae bacterium]|nr:hypothetical protein [Planctomycetaceae bacterium]|tara:strand:- start:137 stop:511 length:375 start_codon:yes stop_codon:yes gene_type:complete
MATAVASSKHWAFQLFKMGVLYDGLPRRFLSTTSPISRIVVVGADKAGAGMEAALAEIAEAKQLQGWVNVPEDCVRPLQYITLHGTRPAGMNEPTEADVAGSEKILELGFFARVSSDLEDPSIT